MLDLLLTGGRVIDPSQGLDSTLALGLKDGLVVYLGESDSAPSAHVTHDVSGKLVVPGLVDLHTHVYWGATSLGIDPDKYLATGVCTYVDTGSAGHGNWRGFHEHVIRRSTARIYSFVNISVAGLAVLSSWLPRWERTPLQHMSVPGTVDLINEFPEEIIGIKVMASGQYTSDGITAVQLAVEAGRMTNKPVMVHFDFPPPSVAEILKSLRPGDVLTHSFRAGSNALLAPSGELMPEALEARERGVIFDVGHGTGSFSWDVARGLLDSGFKPDVISSDVHTGCINGPAYDLPTTMSKFLSLGLSLEEVIEATTWRPAKVIGKTESIGNLRPGAFADVSVLELRTGEFEYEDGVRTSFASTAGLVRNRLIGHYRLVPVQTIIGGRVVAETTQAYGN